MRLPAWSRKWKWVIAGSNCALKMACKWVKRMGSSARGNPLLFVLREVGTFLLVGLAPLA